MYFNANRLLKYMVLMGLFILLTIVVTLAFGAVLPFWGALVAGMLFSVTLGGLVGYLAKTNLNADLKINTEFLEEQINLQIELDKHLLDLSKLNMDVNNEPSDLESGAIVSTETNTSYMKMAQELKNYKITDISHIDLTHNGEKRLETLNKIFWENQKGLLNKVGLMAHVKKDEVNLEVTKEDEDALPEIGVAINDSHL